MSNRACGELDSVLHALIWLSCQTKAEPVFGTGGCHIILAHCLITLIPFTTRKIEHTHNSTCAITKSFATHARGFSGRETTRTVGMFGMPYPNRSPQCVPMIGQWNAFNKKTLDSIDFVLEELQ